MVLLGTVRPGDGAEPERSPQATNPRHSGSPFIRSWLAEDYGAGPVSYRVLQHPQTGLIYVANESGVLEFDGARWRVIPSPAGRMVVSLAVDRKGRVWGCGQADLFRLEPDETGTWRARSQRERLPDDLLQRAGFVELVATADGVYIRDQYHLVFLGADDEPARTWPIPGRPTAARPLWELAGHVHVNPGRMLRRPGDQLEPVPGIKGVVLAARPLPDGTHQVLSDSSVDRWDGTTRTVLRTSLADDRAQTATFLADGRIAFGTRNQGIIICDPDGRPLQQIDRASGLPANSVTHLMEDREGGLWATLRFGLARVQLDSPYARHGRTQGREGSVQSLALSAGTLFVAGTENAVRRAPDGRFEPVQLAPGPDRTVIALGDWVYFLGPRLRALQPALGHRARELENRNYFGLLPLTTAPGWHVHGSHEGLRWARFSGDKWVSEGPLNVPIGNARPALESPAGVAWCHGGGTVWRVDFRAGLRADAPTVRYGPAEGLAGPQVELVRLGGDIVAATAGRLFRFHPEANRFEPETRVRDLVGFAIERVGESADGGVWLLGGPPAREIRRLVPDAADRWRAERLPGPALTNFQPAALLHDPGQRTLWIGGPGELISRDLEWRPASPGAPPAVALRRIETTGGRVLADLTAATGAPPPLRFDPDHTGLRFVFAAPTFTADHAGINRTQYRTQLEGLENKWSDWSPKAERDFTNLPWREFAFRVQARDGAEQPLSEARVAFAIRPAWWATRWAWFAYGTLALVGLTGVVQLRTRIIRRSHERLELTVATRTAELAESNRRLAASIVELDRLRRLELDQKIAAQLAEEKARLEVLRYQLNPHFLYNSLNSIYGLIFDNTRAAGEMVLRLSEFCRSTLTGPTDGMSTIDAEVATLGAYLDVEKVRWGERLKVGYEISPQLGPVPLPPFLLLPLVENAIKHGARTATDRIEIVIRARWEAAPAGAAPADPPATLALEIANRGRWVPPDATRDGSTGIGLENLRQRLRRYYPDAHRFAIDAAGDWVRVRVSLDPAGLRAEAGAVTV